MKLDSSGGSAWRHALSVTRPALLLAPQDFVHEIAERLNDAGVIDAVASHDTAVIFDWIVRLLSRQGISNHAAEVFAERNGSPTWDEISAHMARSARCTRLRSHWHFHDCGYRRSTETCATPHHRCGCTVAALPARKGALAVAAVALWLFIRDVCDNDLVGWIDGRLADADSGRANPRRASLMRAALLDPLVSIPGTGPKVWSMILAELLLAGDPDRERWVTTGASFVAVDSLVHNYLDRTGILSRLGAAHPYGAACHSAGGCVDVLNGLAERIDAREFNPAFPAIFPRWVQFSIWLFCAAGGRAICNGNASDDGVGCRQRFCPSYAVCDRRPIAVPAGVAEPSIAPVSVVNI